MTLLRMSRDGDLERLLTMRVPSLSRFSAFAATSLLSFVFASSAAATDPGAYYDPMKKAVLTGTSLHTVLAGIETAAFDHFPAGPACPATPVGGYPTTSDRFLFLSEILPGSIPVNNPDCGFYLGCFLDQAPTDPYHAHSTLVIDRQCRVARTLVVPDRFEIAGVGMDGSGSLVFDLPDGARAMRFAPAVGAAIRHSKIRDLSIGNLVCCGQTGIDLSNSSLVQLANLRISGFTRGIFGQTSFMHHITGSNLSTNGFAIVLGYDTTTWRIRDTASSFNQMNAIVFDPTTRQTVVSGGVYESNPFAGIDVSGYGNTIESTWFEGNGLLINHRGLVIRSGSVATTVLTSTFSIDQISDVGTNSRRCFNFSPDLYNPNSCP